MKPLPIEQESNDRNLTVFPVTFQTLSRSDPPDSGQQPAHAGQGKLQSAVLSSYGCSMSTIFLVCHGFAMVPVANQVKSEGHVVLSQSLVPAADLPAEEVRSNTHCRTGL